MIGRGFGRFLEMGQMGSPYSKSFLFVDESSEKKSHREKYPNKTIGPRSGFRKADNILYMYM